VAGTRIVSGINRHYDTSSGHNLVAEVTSLRRETWVKRAAKRGKDHYEIRYFAALSPREIPPDSPLTIPSQIRVEPEIFPQLTKGSLVTITVCDGFLDLPWYCDLYLKS
jgi:hypothetical protein